MSNDSFLGGGTLINPQNFDFVVIKLREFFRSKGFVEVHTQNRLSILAACEDPSTMTTYNYAGQEWPLPQTGQMWLEYELLSQPDLPGLFCVSTSYRNEPNPIPGRHDMIFPMFEFELKGGIDALETLERDLLNHLGYGTVQAYPSGDYMTMGERYKTFVLEHEHEQRIHQDYGPVFLLKNFPSYTSPFWNMQRQSDTRFSNKIDVILSGMETIGSAERSCSVEEMRRSFQTISDGMYAKTLYSKFGRARVDAELEQFLSFEFFPRSGGGIGLTRLISSMETEGLLQAPGA